MSTALLLIDVQKNMLQPPEPVPAATSVSAVIQEVLEYARKVGWTVVHIRNNGEVDDPDAPGSPGWELVYPVLEGEHVVDKYESNAFEGTALGTLVPSTTAIVMVGMQSEYCIRETALAARKRENPVMLVRGSHATYDGDFPAATISARVEQELAEAGVIIVDTVDLDRLVS